jgi:hypothetical protein
MLWPIITHRFIFATLFLKVMAMPAPSVSDERVVGKSRSTDGVNPTKHTQATKTSRNFGFPKLSARLQQGRDGPDGC